MLRSVSVHESIAGRPSPITCGSRHDKSVSEGYVARSRNDTDVQDRRQAGNAALEFEARIAGLY